MTHDVGAVGRRRAAVGLQASRLSSALSEEQRHGMTTPLARLVFMIVLVVGMTAATPPAAAETAVMLQDINPGAGMGFSSVIVQGGIEIWDAPGRPSLFFASPAGTDLYLWKTDGTAAGTSAVKQLPLPIGGFVSTLVAQAGDGTLYWPGLPSGLWRSNGTAAGTFYLRFFSNYVSPVMAIGSTMFVHGDDGSGTGVELWKTDGTIAGTVLVKDINPGAASSNLSFLGAVANGLYFFEATHPSYGAEPWVSDGTAAGTQLLKDVRPGAAGSTAGLRWFTAVNGKVYFSADDGTHGPEMWITDGTTAGTQMLTDRPTGAGFANTTALGSLALFVAHDSLTGSELWRSNGTPAGTVLVKDIYTGTCSGSPCSSDPEGLVAVGGNVLFTAEDGSSGRELWRSDGTNAGTVRVKDIKPGAASGVPSPLTGLYSKTRPIGGVFYFAANDGTTGSEPWRSDGTAAGTYRVADVNPGPSDGGPGFFANAGGRVVFAVDDGVHGLEPWLIAACGNGITEVEAGEQCDHGAGNGTGGCCSAACLLLGADTDGDGFCNTLGSPPDNCPAVANPDQGNLDGDVPPVGDLCDTCPGCVGTTCCKVPRTTKGLIGSSAGLVQTPDGAVRIDVPAGTFATPTSVSVTGVDQSSYGLGGSAGNYTVVARLGPAGALGQKVTLTYTWPDQDADNRADVDLNNNGVLDAGEPEIDETNLKLFHNGKRVGACAADRSIACECSGNPPCTTSSDCQGLASAQCAATDCGSPGGNPNCDRVNNRWIFKVDDFSEIALGGEPCGPLAEVKLGLKKIAAPAGDDLVTLKAVLTLPPGTAVGDVAPLPHGLRLSLGDEPGATTGSVLDVHLDGTAFDGVRGWKVNGAGTKWTYADKGATPAGGIVKAALQDRSKKAPGLVAVAWKGKRGSYAATAAVTAAVALADGALCYQASFPGPDPKKQSCVATGGGTGLKCQWFGSTTSTTTSTSGPPTTSTSTTSTTLPACPAGVRVGPACWLFGTLGQSCATVCAGAGLVTDPATSTYAGSGGTDGQCNEVLDALGAVPGNLPFVVTSCSVADECMLAIGGGDTQRARCLDLPIDPNASSPFHRRTCACQ